jgi:type VI secretion system secreted protein VgrG
MPFTQDDRIIAIETPLGDDVLLLQSFRGWEGISALFNYDLDLLSENPSIDFDSIVGKNVTISVELADGSERFFNGIISDFRQGGCDATFTHYNATMVPWTWLLGQTTDCRIFQNMTVPDIVEKIFTDHGFADYANHLQGNYEQRDYCVQYRETDFNFLSRLLEDCGIFYYFRHERGKHTLVLADTPDEHEPCAGQNRARYQRSSRAVEEEDVISGWVLKQQVKPGKCVLTDYNFETPANDLSVSVESTHPPVAGQQYEIYDYPGGYVQRGQGETRVRTRIEEQETERLLAEGSSNCRAFASGYRFELADHYREDINQDYVLVWISHSAVENGYVSGDFTDFDYTNNFTCIPHSVPFRPPRLTRKPVVAGSQTAVVVGKEGEEIWVDRYGRVKIQFHWDREGTSNEESSCWIRVSHPWAGRNWGAISIPRIGQEVIVDFLEGDPDQPIITGRVYNAQQMPPYGLPADQTQSGIKSRSSKGGAPSNFNEIRFEDKKGQEQIFLQAEKNWVIRVKSDQTATIGHDRSETVAHDKREEVGNDKQEQIGHDKVSTIARNCTELVGIDYSLTARNVTIYGLAELTLMVGTSSIQLGPDSIQITSPRIALTGAMININ